MYRPHTARHRCWRSGCWKNCWVASRREFKQGGGARGEHGQSRPAPRMGRSPFRTLLVLYGSRRLSGWPSESMIRQRSTGMEPGRGEAEGVAAGLDRSPQPAGAPAVPRRALALGCRAVGRTAGVGICLHSNRLHRGGERDPGQQERRRHFHCGSRACGCCVSKRPRFGR